MIRSVPLLVFVVIAYNVLTLIAGSNLDATVFSIHMPSRGTWSLSLGTPSWWPSRFVCFISKS